MKAPIFPYIVGWSITNKCNLKCVHCNMASGQPWKDELDFNECCMVIDQLSEGNVKTILFTGGEPLIREDFFDICDYALNKKIELGVTTNSTLVTDSIIREEMWKFKTIRISIDSMIPERHNDFRGGKGIFEHAIKIIKEMVFLGYYVSVSTCISRRNINELESMAEYFSNLGVSHWCLPLLSPDGRGKKIEKDVLHGEEIVDFIKRIKLVSQKYPQMKIGIDLPYAAIIDNDKKKYQSKVCVAAITELTIFANGDVSPCFAMVTSAGNVREAKISNIWNDSKMFNEFRDKSLIHGKCHNCGYRDACGGGCRANAFIKNGDYLGDDNVCWL